jgi:hypothetical protein
MLAICGIAAFLIFVLSVIVIARAIKTGSIYDCLEDSKTEGAWVYRQRNPRKFRSLISIYIAIFSAVIIGLAKVSLSGE